LKLNSDVQAEEVTPKVATHRTLSFFWQVIIAILTVAGLILAINQLFVLRFFGPVEFLMAYMYALFACFLSAVFLIFPATKRASRTKVPWYDVLLFSLTVAISVYLVIRTYDILHKGWELIPPLHIGILAIVLCPLVLEALRRTGGRALFIVATLFALYPTIADHMPGLLRGAQFSLWNTAVFHALSSSSIVGILTRVFAQLVIGFLFFGVVLVAAGGGGAFMKLAIALLGTYKGGPAKVAIFASAIFGSISGSAVSNVISTGSFTIPTMKKAGYPNHVAAAIEACSSTGGVIMPPIMGAAAFVMASFLDMSYFAVITAAAIPAILYYLGLYLQVHSYAETHNLEGMPSSQIPPLKEALIEALPYVLGIIALVYFLYMGLEGRAPFAASAVLLVLAMVRKRTRLHLKDFFELLQETARSMAMLLGMVAGIGFIVGCMSVTGLGFSFSSEIVSLAGGSIPLLVILGAITSFILGTGMTVTACYIFLAILMAPALITAGLNPLAVHLFVLYWGMASYITPPVALAAVTAAGIADADAFKTGLQSMRLGIVIYVIPFFFVAQPALVLQTPLPEVIMPLFTCILGVVLIAGSLEGYLIKYGRLSPYTRVPIGISGLLLAFPGLHTNIAGACLFILSLGVSLAKRRIAGRRLGYGE
jgi:TRAP transporter 4TM/12TM fusion protein